MSIKSFKFCEKELFKNISLKKNKKKFKKFCEAKR